MKDLVRVSEAQTMDRLQMFCEHGTCEHANLAHHEIWHTSKLSQYCGEKMTVERWLN